MTHFANEVAAPSEQVVDIPLGMAHLAIKGLSEDWWLKFLGDVHWQLIADSVGQKTTVFRDNEGRQMYAAFCATDFRQRQPQMATLGASVQVRSELSAVGRSRLQSNHSLTIEGQEIATFRLISTFVVHEEQGVNASISRATPYLLPVLPEATDCFGREMSCLRKSLEDSVPEGERVTLYPSAGVDFNAVGLLYFPSFSRLFETADAMVNTGQPWSPIKRRTLLYFGNIEIGEAVDCVRQERTEGTAQLFLLVKHYLLYTSPSPRDS